MKLGAEIRRRRLALGWTLERLAEQSGLSPHYLSTVETDKRDPSLSTIVQVAKALGSPPGELFGAAAERSPETVEAARLFESCPAEIREGVLKILRASAKRRR